MFKNVLLPTDGSKLSENAIKAGVAFARSINARVTGCYVVEPFQPYYFGEYNPATGRRRGSSSGERARPARRTCSRSRRPRVRRDWHTRDGW
jgi:nucleotide-binding universal stress UspA family protein